MSLIRKKLKCKSGISLAIALVFFLLCAMVGTVVLSAASVSAGNTARERQLYRETLALTSAANLLSQNIKGMEFSGIYTRTETVTTTVYPDDPDQNTKVETAVTYAPGAFELNNSTLFKKNDNPNPDGTYSDNLNLSSIFFANQEAQRNTTVIPKPVPPEPATMDLTFNKVEEQQIPPVKCQLTVAADYTITAVLQCGENAMTITFPASTEEQTSVAANPAVKHETTTEKTTVTTYTTNLSWEAPVMKEGGTIVEETIDAETT